MKCNTNAKTEKMEHALVLHLLT